MEILTVDFIALPAQDLDRAVAFYRDTLGLTPSQEFAEKGMVEFQAGNFTISLFDPSKMKKPFAPFASGMVALRVPDVEAAMAELKGKGVEFMTEAMDSGVCVGAFFKDSEGNALTLHHRYAPAK